METIFGFSSDPILVNFTQYFLEGRENESNESTEDKMVMWLTYIAYYCLTKDKLSLLPIWVSLLKVTFKRRFVKYDYLLNQRLICLK